jgi:hypothetical protein
MLRERGVGEQDICVLAKLHDCQNVVLALWQHVSMETLHSCQAIGLITIDYRKIGYG